MRARQTDIASLHKLGQLPLFPYVIVVSEFTNIIACYLFINDQKFNYEDPIKAVEACLKCLLALEELPYMSDFMWKFIIRIIFEFDYCLPVTKVNNLITEIKKTTKYCTLKKNNNNII